MHRSSKVRNSGLAALALFGVFGCSNANDPIAKPRVEARGEALLNRAYIVSQDSDELTVIDLDKLEIVAQVATGGASNHMADVSSDGKKVFIDSSHTNEVVVVDARTLEVTNRVPLGNHPAHLSATPDGRLFAIMVEDDNQVAFFDPIEERVVKRLDGFSVPHFMRFDREGKFGYVANIGGNHVSRVDMDKLEIVEEIALSGMSIGPSDQEEGGFADAQISPEGILYAAHHTAGRVLVYDTLAQKKLSELPVGKLPWVAFAEHPFHGVALRHLVPNFGDKTLSLIDAERVEPKVWKTLEGDEEAYGVNFSPLTPELSFVMNRVREDIAIVDVEKGDIIERLDVGGNTETAATSADGKLIVAAVSGADSVVVIDVATRQIKKTFEKVGKYPWSVTIPRGQNYCH